MKKKVSLIFASFVLLFSAVGCQSKQEEIKEIPITYDNLTLEQLKEQASIPFKLPTAIPFDPIDEIATLDDYEDLYGSGAQVEELNVRYIKTHREGRYLDVTISNLKGTTEEGQKVKLASGTEAIYSENSIGQMLFWSEDNVNYRLVYYTSNKVNEGQDPLTVEQLAEIANSFEPVK